MGSARYSGNSESNFYFETSWLNYIKSLLIIQWLYKFAIFINLISTEHKLSFSLSHILKIYPLITLISIIVLCSGQPTRQLSEKEALLIQLVGEYDLKSVDGFMGTNTMLDGIDSTSVFSDDKQTVYVASAKMDFPLSGLLNDRRTEVQPVLTLVTYNIHEKQFDLKVNNTESGPWDNFNFYFRKKIVRREDLIKFI